MIEDEMPALARIMTSLQSNDIELAARIDGVELLLASIGILVGMSPDELVSNLRVAQATCRLKRLQLEMDQNNAEAAELDNQIDHPPIDEDLLRMLDIGNPPSDTGMPV